MIGELDCRATLASAVLCENFQLVLQVIGRSVLPASFPQARLCARVVSSFSEASLAGYSEKVMGELAVLEAVLAVLVSGSDDDVSAAEAIDSCTAFVPRLFRLLSPTTVTPVSNVFLLLLRLRPALFAQAFQPRFLATLTVLQEPATAPTFAALVALKSLFPEEVHDTVFAAVNALLHTYNTEEVPDAMLLGKLMEQITLFLSKMPWGRPLFLNCREITNEVAALLSDDECCQVTRLTHHIVTKALENHPMELRSGVVHCL